MITAAAKRGRYPERDRVLARLVYRHGLRASEACDLRWHHLNLGEGTHRPAPPGSTPVRTFAAARGVACGYLQDCHKFRRGRPQGGLATCPRSMI
jgi:integrase